MPYFRYLLRRSLIAVALLLPATAASYDLHDHLFYIPSGRHFLEAWNEVQRLKMSELYASTGGEASLADENFKVAMQERGLGADTPQGQAIFRALRGRPFRDLTFGEVVDTIARTKFGGGAVGRERAMDLLLALPPTDRVSPNPRLLSAIDRPRGALARVLSPDACYRVFRRAFAEGGPDLYHVHATESAGMGLRRPEVLWAIRQAFFDAAKGSDDRSRRETVRSTDFRLFAGFTRRRFISDFASDLPHLRSVISTAMARRLFCGVDISASALEGFHRDDAAPEVIAAGLLELFRLATELNFEVRLHAFESAADGTFYEGLAMAMEAFEAEKPLRPLRLRFGHITWLDNTHRRFLRGRGWLDFLAARNDRAFSVTVEVNPKSNELVQGADFDRILVHVAEALRRGLRVVMGSDGFGVIPESGYRAQRREAFRRLREILAKPQRENWLHRRLLRCGDVLDLYREAFPERPHLAGSR